MLGACLSIPLAQLPIVQLYLLYTIFSSLENTASMIISKSRFTMIVSNLSETNSPTMNPPLFIFKMCHAVAGYNAKVLAEHNFDLHVIIKKQHPSQISYGSEFHHPDLLEELLFHHPYWPRLKSILLNGAFFPLENI
jgi:hypothetical protein